MTTTNLCLYLPDAPVTDDPMETDAWLFQQTDANGFGDWATDPLELPDMHATYVQLGKPYTCQRYPGMASDVKEAMQRYWEEENSLRWHPSLSAAERNA